MERPLRILMVVHSAKAAGAQLVALEQAAALSADHELLIAVGEGPLRPRFAQLGELVGEPDRLPVWGAPAWRWTLDLARSLSDALRLALIARRRGIDVIVANSTVLISPVIAARLARLPVVVHAQEAPTSRAARRLFRFHGRLATTVVAISPWIESAFRGSRSRIAAIPVGVPLPPQVARPAPREGRVRLLVVGTIDSRKRQDLAIAALQRLVEEGVNAELDIVGAEADVEYAATLKAQVSTGGLESLVHFRGHSSAVATYMQDADILLVPAGEVTPLVLMEAMALGTPAVAARMGSIPDVVLDGETGLLVEPDDPTALANAIHRIIGDRALASRLARVGRAWVEQNFDQRRSHLALRDELRQLAGPAGS